MPARLIVHLPLQPSLSLIAHEGRDYLVGRDESCGLRLEDDRVSRQHARLSGAGLGWVLTDLESKNGTSVNGSPIRSTRLEDRCLLSFGGLLARFERISEQQSLAESQERLRRWQTSFELQRSIDPALGLEEVLRRVLESVRTLSGAERGFLMLADAEGELEVVASAGVETAELWQREFRGSVGAIERALAKNAAVVVSDAQVDTQLGQRPSIQERGIRALLCLPLKTLDRLIGVLYADSLQPGATFDQLDVEILEALAAHAALAIGVASLDQDLKGLAATLAGLPGVEPALAAEIRCEVQRLRVRSFTGARAARGRVPLAGRPPTTWSELRASHLASSESPP